MTKKEIKKRLRSIKYKRVLVEWVDAGSNNLGWAGLEATMKNSVLLPCFSIGFCLSNTKESVVVAQNISVHTDSTRYSDIMTIPKSWIVAIKELR